MLLIKNGRVIDPSSKTDEILDILIDDEKIIKMDKNISALNSDMKIIDAADLVVVPGLIDVHSHFRDPGFTYKEDILSGSRAAARGGYTTVVCMANTNPVVDNEETLNYILNKAKDSKIEILQVASVTKGLNGTELVNMEKLKEAGAVGFSDDGKPIMNSKLVFEAMKRAKELNVPLSFHEEDPFLIKENGINAGEVSKKFGLYGSPSEAEEAILARDLCFAYRTKAKINIQHVSSGVSVKIIEFAKKYMDNVYAEVTPHHFSLTEKDVLKYGTNAKMNPPLRTEEDRISLIEGLKYGTLNIIATDHAPHAIYEKEQAFRDAPSGIIGLETALSLGITNLVRPGLLSIMELIEKMTVNPAKLYNIHRGFIKEGERADLLIFNPNEVWTVEDFSSKACNSPFKGMKLYGKVKKTICKGTIVYED